MNKKIVYGGLLIAIVLAAGTFFTGGKGFGAITGTTNYDNLGVLNLKVGTTCNDQSTYGSCNGTALTRVNTGTCYIWAAANTVAASSTVTAECSGNGTLASALTGISIDDQVFVSLSTSTTEAIGTGKAGLVLVSASASSTSGYIVLKLWNASGNTFTWTAAASTTKYVAFDI